MATDLEEQALMQEQLRQQQEQQQQRAARARQVKGLHGDQHDWVMYAYGLNSEIEAHHNRVAHGQKKVEVTTIAGHKATIGSNKITLHKQHTHRDYVGHTLMVKHLWGASATVAGSRTHKIVALAHGLAAGVEINTKLNKADRQRAEGLSLQLLDLYANKYGPQRAAPASQSATADAAAGGGYNRPSLFRRGPPARTTGIG